MQRPSDKIQRLQSNYAEERCTLLVCEACQFRGFEDLPPLKIRLTKLLNLRAFSTAFKTNVILLLRVTLMYHDLIICGSIFTKF